MARIFQEGFETDFRWSSAENIDNTIKTVKDDGFTRFNLVTGRNAYSKNALYSPTDGGNFALLFGQSLTEFYFRAYMKLDNVDPDTNNYPIRLSNGLDDLVYIRSYGTTGTGVYHRLFVKIGGTLTDVSGIIELAIDQWYRIEIYFKANATTGAYTLKLDGVEVVSDTSLNTGTDGVDRMRGLSRDINYYYDDIAVNDTTGSVNNSWCGEGTIVAIKPNGVGNSSQWNTSSGYWYAEASTSTTSLKLTAHGLSVGDFVYNRTRSIAKRVTAVPDVDTLTVDAITGQVEGDEIVLYAFDSTHSVTGGTANYFKISDMDSIDYLDLVFNETQSEYGIVVYRDSSGWHINYSNYFLYDNFQDVAIGNTLKIYKPSKKTTTNHYEVVDDIIPACNFACIETNTTNDVDTFDMEELVADKGVTSGTLVKAVKHISVVKDQGEGNQFAPILRVNSTDYAGTTQTTILSDKQVLYSEVFDLSPDTSSQWTISEVDAIEAGIKKV